MPQNKIAYFQGGGGVNEPTPGQKKYKSDPALIVQPRFKEPFYRNYDLYTVPGMENVGPGTGWHGLQNYESIKDFLNDRRKHLQSRYVADDSWQLDSGQQTKKNPDVKARMSILGRIIKYASSSISSISQWRVKQDNNSIDFPLDEFMDPAVEEGIDEQADHNTNEIGGFLDDYLPENDFEDKDSSTLNFGRDYTGNTGPDISNEDLQKMVEKYLNSSPTHGLYGLPDGVDLPDEDLEDPNNSNPNFGTTENGITMYEDKWNI